GVCPKRVAACNASSGGASCARNRLERRQLYRTRRLVPFLPKLVPLLERHGHLTLTDAVREQLLAISPATADRLLQPARAAGQPRAISTTKAGTLLKRQIP